MSSRHHLPFPAHTVQVYAACNLHFWFENMEAYCKLLKIITYKSSLCENVSTSLSHLTIKLFICLLILTTDIGLSKRRLLNLWLANI